MNKHFLKGKEDPKNKTQLHTHTGRWHSTAEDFTLLSTDMGGNPRKEKELEEENLSCDCIVSLEFM